MMLQRLHQEANTGARDALNCCDERLGPGTDTPGMVVSLLAFESGSHLEAVRNRVKASANQNPRAAAQHKTVYSPGSRVSALGANFSHPVPCRLAESRPGA